MVPRDFTSERALCWHRHVVVTRFLRSVMGEPRVGRTGYARGVSHANKAESIGFIGYLAVCDSLEPGKPVWAARTLLCGAVPKHTEGKVLACDYDPDIVHVIWSVDTNGEHPGHTSDVSGEQIRGSRFHLNGRDYDLNEAEWRRLPVEEQRRYKKWPPCAVTSHDKHYDGHRDGSLATGGE